LIGRMTRSVNKYKNTPIKYKRVANSQLELGKEQKIDKDMVVGLRIS